MNPSTPAYYRHRFPSEFISHCLPTVEHLRLNNRVESSHEPHRELERRMRGFTSPGTRKRFLSVFGVIASFFRPGRYLLAAVNTGCGELPRDHALLLHTVA
jgi:transposase-like protein